MAVFVRKKNKIDRMRITIPLTPDQCSIARDVLGGIVDAADCPDIKHWKQDYRSGLMLKVNSQPLAQIIAGISKNQYRYLSWELWPDHLSHPEYAPAWEKFQELIKVLMSDFDPSYSLDYAMENGKVSYLEIARDLMGVDKEDLLPWTSHARKGDIWKKEDQKGAIYIGSKDSPRQFVIYDKRLQLIAKGLPCPYPSILRVEARIRNPGLMAKEIESLDVEALFKPLHVASLSKAREFSKEKPWRSFIETASNHGVIAALSPLSKHYRKIYRENLMQCSVNWCK